MALPFSTPKTARLVLSAKKERKQDGQTDGQIETYRPGETDINYIRKMKNQADRNRQTKKLRQSEINKEILSEK